MKPQPLPHLVRRRSLILALLPWLAALALAPPSAAAARRQVPQGFLGVNVGSTVPNREYPVMAGAGMEAVRLPIFWALAQPFATDADVPADRRGSFVDVGGVPTDFSDPDRVIGAAAARGLRALPNITTTPQWAALRPGDAYNASPPRDPATYAAFLAALVHRYGPHGEFWRAHPELRAVPVRAWQIWNEPGQPYYWTEQPFARSYVRLLAAARASIKAADPKASVVLAGLNSGYGYLAWTDLGKVYAAGGGRLFDQAAQNPFTLRTAGVIRSVRLFRGVMARHGDAHKPVLITELSWPSALGKTKLRYGFEVSERNQARRISEAIPLLGRLRTQLHIGAVFWYTWLSPPVGSDQPFDYSGLRRQSGSGIVSKPALAAWRRAARNLEGCAKSSLATVCR